MTIRMWLERCWQAHFRLHMHFLLRIVEHQLQGPHTPTHSDRKVPFGKDVKEVLLDPAVFYCIHKEHQSCSENLANMLSFELPERQVFSSQELIFIQCRLALRNLDFRSYHNFCSG